MKKKELLGFSCLSALLLVFAASMNMNAANAVQTRFSIYDPTYQSNISTANVTETFTVEIRVADVTQLIGWGFYLQWNASILDFVRCDEGPFLNRSGSFQSDFGPVRKPGIPGWPYDDTMYVTNSLIAPTQDMAATGSGVIATVTFSVKAEGKSTLHLHDTLLLGWIPRGMGTPPIIEHVVEDGYFILPAPKIFINPPRILGPAFGVGKLFDINISIANVNNLYNWSLGLSWSPGLLDAMEIAQGPFLKNVGTTNPQPEINQAKGFLNISNTLVGEPLGGVNGSGTLATVTFLVEAKGRTDLIIYPSKLYKSDGSPILHVRVDSSFSNVNIDVAITNVDVTPTSVRVGESVTITVDTRNEGEIEENIDITVYYGNKTVESRSVSDLPAGNSTTLTIEWKTISVTPGTYTITAKADPVPGEVNLDNNVKEADKKVTVSGGLFDMMPLLIGGVVVAATGGTTGFFLYRRRSKNRNKS